MNRRELLLTANCLATGALVNNKESPRKLEESSSRKWQIGCLNRPWNQWTFDDAFDGLKAAGFKEIGLLGDHKGETFIYPESTPEHLKRLSARIDERGLKVIFGRLHTRFERQFK